MNLYAACTALTPRSADDMIAQRTPQIIAAASITAYSNHGISVHGSPQANQYLRAHLQGMAPEEGRIDLYQTTGSSPPVDDRNRDENLAQCLRAIE